MSARTIVAVNGCFDIIHLGHIRLLEAARSYGERLIVGINSDASVRDLKGQGRPVFSEIYRREFLLGLKGVDAVQIFGGSTARDFLAETQPHFWVKGGDYSRASVDPGELEIVERYGGQLIIAKQEIRVSTTDIIQKIIKSHEP